MIFRTILDSRSEEEKCCHNKMPIDCFGLCTPVSSAGKLASSKNIVDVCKKLWKLISECRDISKGTFKIY